AQSQLRSIRVFEQRSGGASGANSYRRPLEIREIYFGYSRPSGDRSGMEAVRARDPPSGTDAHAAGMGRPHPELRGSAWGSDEGGAISAGAFGNGAMNLLELQRRMAGAIMAPLSAGDHLALKSPNGNSMKSEAAELVKPNDRLTSAERLEIYARSYWYRILDALYSDFPGLRAIIGARAFERLSRQYLAELPSESFTLRDLG